jgi:hypothetical protein
VSAIEWEFVDWSPPVSLRKVKHHVLVFAGCHVGHLTYMAIDNSQEKEVRTRCGLYVDSARYRWGWSHVGFEWEGRWYDEARGDDEWYVITTGEGEPDGWEPPLCARCARAVRG